MSKNISIQEGGVAKQLTVDKLKTNLVSSGTCLWVPEDEVQLTTKSITENGTYKASDDGYYGYSEVIVSGQGTATGTDGDGDESVATTGPSGELEITKVPSSIKVITPPTVAGGTYTDGQSITTDGMVVKAYLASGGVYGTVPNGEITLTPSTAAYDPSSVVSPTGEAISDLETNLSQPIAFLPAGCVIGHVNNFTDEYRYYFDCDTIWCINNNHIIVYGVADDPSKLERYYYKTWRTAWQQPEPENYNYVTFIRSSSNFVHDGKTAYYGAHAGWYSIFEWRSQPPLINTSSYPTGADAWTLLYGTITESAAGSKQTITVSWPRPKDAKVLTTSFDIIVATPAQ